jgi:hypothetical protein
MFWLSVLISVSPAALADDDACGDVGAGVAVVADLDLAAKPDPAAELPLVDRVEAAFDAAADVSLNSVVRSNSTGEAIKKDGELQYQRMEGVSAIKKLDSGALLIRSGLQVDADGSADSTTVDPDHGQVQTSLRYPDRAGQSQYVNTHEIPFFVLPLGWYQGHGVKLGDVAAVMYSGRLAYAIFADVGPDEKLGEGSLALHEALGNDPWITLKSGVVKPWGGIDEGVTMVVFPGSGDGTPQTPEAITRIGIERLTELLGSAPPPPSEVQPRLPTLRRGDEGAYVERLQEALKAAGFYEGEIDGDFGRGTKKAVKAFQDDRDLEPDGVVGRDTWTALLSGG